MKSLNEFLGLKNKKACVALRTSQQYLQECIDRGIIDEIKNIDNNVDLKIGTMGVLSGIPIFIDETITDKFELIYE